MVPIVFRVINDVHQFSISLRSHVSRLFECEGLVGQLDCCIEVCVIFINDLIKNEYNLNLSNSVKCPHRRKSSDYNQGGQF